MSKSIAKKNIILALIWSALSITVCSAYAQSSNKDFFKITQNQIVWQEGEKGVRSTVIFGDPTKPGIYVVRNIFPAGIMSSPHTHNQDRYVTVIRGTWNTGTSADWDPSRTVALPVGSFMFHPAGGVHFDGSLNEEVEVQIIGMGPVSTDFLYPKEGHFGKPHKLN